MDPVTTDTLASSSLVPWPKELSLVPLARSSPRTRLGALVQSMLPAVLTTRLPSLLSKVLPCRLARPGDTSARVETTVAVTARLKPRRNLRYFACNILTCGSLLCRVAKQHARQQFRTTNYQTQGGTCDAYEGRPTIRSGMNEGSPHSRRFGDRP